VPCVSHGVVCQTHTAKAPAGVDLMFEAVVEVGKNPTAATDCGGHVQEEWNS